MELFERKRVLAGRDGPWVHSMLCCQAVHYFRRGPPGTVRPRGLGFGALDAARLGRHRGGACLYRAPVPGGELWRPHARAGTRPPQPAADLSLIARDLLHVLDLLRLGRLRFAHRLRVPHHLYRPGADGRPVLAADRARGAAGQGAEHHLDRRLHRRALRQGPGGGGDGGADRHRRDGSLHRAAAQSGVVLARDHHRPCLARRRGDAPGARRHIAVRRAPDGGLRGAVRHPPHRRHRTPGRPDAGDRDRIDRQAVRLPGGRHLRDLLDVRRPGRAVGYRLGASRHRGDLHAQSGARYFPRHHAVVVRRDHPFAAPVPRRGGGEPQRSRDQARGLAIPALSRADQPVRGADRARRAF